MKKKLLLILIFFSIQIISAQTYMEKIGANTCKCIEKISSTESEDERNMGIGLCMIKSAAPFKKQLKRDHKIDVSDLTNSKNMESLGALVGIEMASSCPEALLSLVVDQIDDTDGESSSMLKGTVNKIEKELFICFSIKNYDTGKTNKYYWLGEIETGMDLKETYNDLLNQDIDFDFTTEELFDPKINDYRTFNVITVLEKM